MKLTEGQQKIVEDNIRLAGYMTQKWIKKGVHNIDYEEIFSLFSFALCKAAASFDPKRGAKFATYAGRCMENEIKMAFRRKSRGAGENSEVTLGTVIASDEDGGEVMLQEVLRDNSHLEYDRITDIMYAKEALNILSDRDLTILKSKYFFEETQKEIAKRLNISQSYVSRIEKVILRRLGKWDRDRVS
jgi:RNA polymerase sporulation-specific sigma factor